MVFVILLYILFSLYSIYIHILADDWQLRFEVDPIGDDIKNKDPNPKNNFGCMCLPKQYRKHNGNIGEIIIIIVHLC